MQNSTNKTDNVLNTIPEHFPSTAPSIDASDPPERPQNFSFSSAYTASRFGSGGTHFSIVDDHLSESSPITSFTVLNLDDLATTYGSKPNAIVRPFRRPEQPESLPRNDSDSASVNQSRQQGSESSVTQYGKNLRMNGGGLRDERSFAEELNRKLRFLHLRESSQDPWTKSRTFLKNANNQQSVTSYKRPLFITTVPTGIFLPPAREAPLPPSLRRRIYAYSSHPVVLGNSYNYNNNHLYNNTYNEQACKNKRKSFTNNNKIPGTSLSGDKYNKKTSSFSKDKLRNNNNNNHSYNNDNFAPIGFDDKNIQYTTQTTNSTGPLRVRGISVGSSVGGGNGNGNGDGGGGGSDGGGDDEGPTYAEVTDDSTRTPLLGVLSKTHKQMPLRRGKRETPVEPYKNVMHDRRVVRGTIFGGNQPLLAESGPFDRAGEISRRRALRKITQARNLRNIIGTPPPVPGRCHGVIQTDKYLEELFERPPACTVDTQTDLFLELPPTPPYVPASVGVDVATEIGEGELFHFDAEAQPIIDILVDSCIEQSMLEVAHEQEIAELRRKQDEFLAHREAELAELRRLEAEEIRLKAEKERRIRQDIIAKELDDEMQKGVTAAKLLQGHIASLLPEVLDNLEPASDASKKEKLMTTICPWLSAEVAEEVGQIVDSREMLTAIIQEIIKQRAAAYAGYKEEAEPGTRLQGICFEDEEGDEGEVECCTCHSEQTEECPVPLLDDLKKGTQ